MRRFGSSGVSSALPSPGAARDLALTHIIFGATADLALRKLIPALASLASRASPQRLAGHRRLPREQRHEAYRAEVREAMPPELLEAWKKLEPCVTTAPARAPGADVKRLSDHLDGLPAGRSGRLFYLSPQAALSEMRSGGSRRSTARRA